MGLKVGPEIGRIPVHKLEKDNGFPWWGWLVILFLGYVFLGGK